MRKREREVRKIVDNYMEGVYVCSEAAERDKKRGTQDQKEFFSKKRVVTAFRGRLIGELRKKGFLNLEK